jgi:potassium channel subfamily K protein 1
MIFLAETSNGRLIALILFYIFYLFAGATVFDSIESPHEAKIIKDLNIYVKQFRQKLNSCQEITDEVLNNFIRDISTANNKGVPATRNVSKEQNWSFGNAVFFAGTVLTTIGYGNVSPLTKLGKLFCILFAIIGIPATLLLLYAIIERLMKLTGFMLAFFTEKVLQISNNISVLNQKVKRSHLHVLFALLCTLFVLIFFFIIPAAIYSSIEGWSYLNAFYYCFISLSTVGLGDYVPGESHDQNNLHFYKIASIAYLLVGVTVMVWLLEIFSETPEFNLYQLFTLTKDGILTSHRDTVHMAKKSPADSSSQVINSDIKKSKTERTSPVTYQRQQNESDLNNKPTSFDLSNEVNLNVVGSNEQ